MADGTRGPNAGTTLDRTVGAVKNVAVPSEPRALSIFWEGGIPRLQARVVH
jgi:hypothetical protein